MIGVVAGGFVDASGGAVYSFLGRGPMVFDGGA